MIRMSQFALCWLLLLLSACGGGGGGSSPSGSFTLSTNSVSFSAPQNGAAPAAQTVQLHLTAPGTSNVGAGYANGEQQPSWLNVSITGSGSDYNVNFSITGTGYSPGLLSVVVTVGTADANGNILQTQSINVSYMVRNQLAFTSSPITQTFVEGPTAGTHTQTVGVSGNGIQYTVSSSAPWLVVPSGTQSGSGSFNVTLNDSGLALGQYAATLTVTEVGNPSDTATLAVSLTVRAPVLTFSSAAPSATLTLGSSQFSATLPLTTSGDSTSFTATSSAGWLQVPSGTLTSPGTFNVTVDETGLDVGSHQATVTATDIYDTGVTTSIQVTLVVVAPVISAGSTSVLLGGANGMNTGPVPLAVSINTGTNTYPWTASLSTNSGGNWFVASPTSGKFSQTPASISLSANLNNLHGGTYTGQLMVQTTVAGHVISASVPVTLNWAGNRLRASSNGVAFSNFPSHQLLTRTLVVSSTTGSTSVPWQASSKQSWLSATTSGTSGGNLVLTANPSGLAQDQFYLAEVTLSSTDQTVENREVVRVGLWVGSTNPQALYLNVPTLEIETDPVEPYVFANDGGTDVTVYNVYSGAVVKTFAGAAQQLGRMASSTDGATLFVEDVSAYKIYAIDVESGKVNATAYQDTSTLGNGFDIGLIYVRPQGHPVLVVGTGSIFDVQSGSLLGEASNLPGFAATGDTLAASADGLNIYALNEGLSPSTLNHYVLAYSELNRGALSVTFANGASPGSNGGQVAVSSDATRVYTSNGSPYDFPVFNGTSLEQVATLAGTNYPDSGTVAWNDVYLGGVDGYYATDDIFVYDAAGNALGQIKSTVSNGSIRNHGLRVSGDGWRAVATVAAQPAGPGATLSIQDVPGQ